MINIPLIFDWLNDLRKLPTQKAKTMSSLTFFFFFFFTVGWNRALPSKTALRRDWETGFCVATAFFVKRIQRIRNCGWSSANTVVPWQRFVIYCRSVFTRAITTWKYLFPFFRKFCETVVFRRYFYAWFSRSRADRLESLEFLGRLGRSAAEEWPKSIFS